MPPARDFGIINNVFASWLSSSMAIHSDIKWEYYFIYLFIRNYIYYFNLHFTYFRQIIYWCSHQLTNYEKESQMYLNLFYDYHLVYILAIVWDTSTSISNSAVFLQKDLILATQIKFLFKSNFLKLTAEGLFFQKWVVLTVHWEHQRYKCTMVSLKYCFIVTSFHFFFFNS